MHTQCHPVKWWVCFTVFQDDVMEMETFSTLLALVEGNSMVTGEFPSQRPVTQSFDVFFDQRLNKRLSKPSRHRWFEMSPRSLWRHCTVGPYLLIGGPFLGLWFYWHLVVWFFLRVYLYNIYYISIYKQLVPIYFSSQIGILILIILYCHIP